MLSVPLCAVLVGEEARCVGERVHPVGGRGGRRWRRAVVDQGVEARPREVAAGVVAVLVAGQHAVALDAHAVGHDVPVVVARPAPGRRAVDRLACADAAHQARGCVDHRCRPVAGITGAAIVFDADGVVVVVRGVPGLVVLAHHLGDLAIGAADHVVRRYVRRRVAEPRDAAGVAAFDGVHDHRRAGVVGGAVIAAVRGIPQRLAEIECLDRGIGRACGALHGGRSRHGVVVCGHRIAGVVQLQCRCAQQAQTFGRKRLLHLDRQLRHPYSVAIGAARQGLQHLVGEALAREAFDVAVAAAVARVTRQRTRHRFHAGVARGARAVALHRARQQRGRGEDVGFRIAQHQRFADPEQRGAIRHLVVEAATAVQAHHAVRGGHMVVAGVAVGIGFDVHPVGFHQRDRFQHAARDFREALVGAAEVEQVLRALPRLQCLCILAFAFEEPQSGGGRCAFLRDRRYCRGQQRNGDRRHHQPVHRISLPVSAPLRLQSATPGRAGVSWGSPHGVLRGRPNAWCAGA